MRILKSNEKNLPKSGNHEKAICFWQEEFIKHTVLVEFSQKGRYDNTVFLNLMEKRVKEYVNSPNYSLDQDMKNMIDKYFTKHNGKYIQMEQRKLLQTEKRNEGIPLSLAKVIIASYGFPEESAYFFGKSSLGIKAVNRKKYLDGEKVLLDDEQDLGESQKGFLTSSLNSHQSVIISNNLSGFWLSRFTYKAKRGDKIFSGSQYDLELIFSVDKYTLIGKNILCANQSGKEYFHDLRVQIAYNNLLGSWSNTNTKNIGVMQLYIHTNNIVMSGKHLGNSNDNSIQEGEWHWIKVKPSVLWNASSVEILKTQRLIDIDNLEASFDLWLYKEMEVNIEDLIRL